MRHRGLRGQAATPLRVLVAVAIAVVALLAAGPAAATTTTVNCVHGNLQKKIDNVDPDSTSLIKGTRTGQFTINKSLKLVGDPTATLDGEKAGTVLTIMDGPVLLSHLKVTGGLFDRDRRRRRDLPLRLERSRCAMSPSREAASSRCLSRAAVASSRTAALWRSSIGEPPVKPREAERRRQRRYRRRRN